MIESQFLLMEYSPRNSLQIIREFSDITLVVTMPMRKKYKLQPVPPSIPLEAL